MTVLLSPKKYKYGVGKSNFYCLNIIWYKVSIHRPCNFYCIDNIWYNDTVDTQRDYLVNKLLSIGMSLLKYFSLDKYAQKEA